jgi:hypothetical protein
VLRFVTRRNKKIFVPFRGKKKKKRKKGTHHSVHKRHGFYDLVFVGNVQPLTTTATWMQYHMVCATCTHIGFKRNFRYPPRSWFCSRRPRRFHLPFNTPTAALQCTEFYTCTHAKRTTRSTPLRVRFPNWFESYSRILFLFLFLVNSICVHRSVGMTGNEGRSMMCTSWPLVIYNH